MQTQVYLSLGGNEGEVLPRLRCAIQLLALQAGVTHVKTSHFYCTAPIQVTSPLWFINAVCSFYTHLPANEIFKMTQAIEVQLGKIPKPKEASCPIDIDLLFYGQHVWQDQELEIPHPRWKERLFVLIPLKDLTQEISLQGALGKEYYFLPHLISPLLRESPQSVYLHAP